MFPVSNAGNIAGADRKLMPQVIDFDLTGWHERPFAYDPGAWTGWKDDHPSSMQASGAFWETLADCSYIHFRHDESSKAGGHCSYETPNVALTFEDIAGYSLNSNIFETDLPPIGVGPRLPETRRNLFALVLLNNRRSTPVSI